MAQVAADAIRTAFHPTTPGFRGLIDRFLAEREQLLKGPYVSVALPVPPHRHQEKAFQRLLPGSPVNTLVATGTGSGKTETFLLPLLEHCRQQHAQGTRGIKAILIYPMNALATDQARLLADLIHTTPALAGLGAGLYIGAALERLLQSVLLPSQGSTDTFFQPDQPLGSFGARITLAARLGLIDPPVEQALQTLRRVRNTFAHSTTTATLADPSHANRLAQAYAAARCNTLWPPLERILQEKVGGDGSPLDPALRDYILLITILVAFLEAAGQQLSPQPPAVVMGLTEINWSGYGRGHDHEKVNSLSR